MESCSSSTVRAKPENAMADYSLLLLIIVLVADASCCCMFLS
jgi:hypothetical protein